MKKLLILLFLFGLAAQGFGMGFPFNPNSMERFEIRRSVVKEELLLSFMNEHLLEATEQTLLAALTKRDDQAITYNELLDEFDFLADKYKKTVAIGKSGNEELSIEFTSLLVAKYKAQKAGASLWQGTINQKTINNFKEATAEFNRLFNQYLETAILLAKPGKSKFSGAALDLTLIREDLQEGINQALLYFLTETEADQQGFFIKLADFEAKVKDFNQLGYLSTKEEFKLAKMFDQMVALKKAVEINMTKLLAKVNNKEQLSLIDLQQFVKDLQTFNLAYNKLLEEFLRKSL